MKKDVIFDIFALLKQSGLAETESEFSLDWLGQSESYLRGLRFKKTEPSLGAIAVCASRLQRAGEQMIASEHYRQLGQRFVAMSERCHEVINEDSVELDLAPAG